LSAAAPDSVITQIVCPAGNERPRNSEGDVIKLKHGRLLLAYSEFVGADGSDFGAARISAKTSRDGGRSWSPPFVLMPNEGKMNVMSPSLLRLRSGKLAFTYMLKNSLSDNQIWFRTSSNESKSWSEPVRVNAEHGYWGINNARLIQLRSGRIIAPLWFVNDWNKSHHTKDVAAYSDDEGKTWALGEVVDIPQGPRGADEPGVVELRDGKLLMMIRSDLGHIFRSYSSDAGQHWTAAEPTTLDSPTAPSTIVRIPKTGDLLLIWNNHKRGATHMDDRFPLSSAVSSDEGLTWTHMQSLDETPGFTYAYTSVTFTRPDTAILTYYARQNSGAASENAVLPGEARGQPVLSLKEKIVPVAWFYGALRTHSD
jgi:predicted neuraminidase